MTQKGDETGPEEGPIAEVDRIRDIIFGSQMRTYEQQFKRVAGQLDQINTQLDELRASLDRQRADLEGQTLKLQEATRQGQSELERTFSSQLAQLRAALDKQGADLTAQLRDQAAELRKQGQDLRGEFTQALDALENDKTSRGHLGDLLVEMGMRLKQQADISDLLGQLGKVSAK
jgi:DNA repair exonuclease SbcCD ATPase subunit